MISISHFGARSVDLPPRVDGVSSISPADAPQEPAPFGDDEDDDPPFSDEELEAIRDLIEEDLGP